MKSTSRGRPDLADQVGEEDERALEHADHQRGPAGVVGADLLAELGDPRPDLVRADDDAPQGVIVDVVARVRGVASHMDAKLAVPVPGVRTPPAARRLEAEAAPGAGHPPAAGHLAGHRLAPRHGQHPLDGRRVRRVALGAARPAARR